jgi:LysR family transcriptional regulator of gallate degradation
MQHNARVSLRVVRAVLATLDEGSISRAAAAQFASQPALSRLVKIAEQRLGVKLFDRRPDGVVPCGQAGPVFDRFLRVREQLERASLELSQIPEMEQIRVPLYRHLALRHLRAIAVTHDKGSATAAAESLGLSTTAVARAIRDIEALIGQPLFSRHTGRLVPTPVGRALATHAKLVLHELRYARDEVVARSGTLSGHVTIGSLPLPRTLLVPEALGRLSRRHPGLSFSIIEGPYRILLDGLQCGDLDLLVGALREPAPAKTVRQEPLFQTPLSIVVRRGHPLTGRGRVAVEELAHATWVVASKGTPTYQHFKSFFQESGLPIPREVVECSSLIATRALLLENDWITIISRHQIHYEEQFGILEVLPIELPGSSRPIGVTLRSDTVPPPAVAGFIAELRAVSDKIIKSQTRSEARVEPSISPAPLSDADLLE